MKKARSELLRQYATINVNQTGEDDESIIGLDDTEYLWKDRTKLGRGNRSGWGGEQGSLLNAYNFEILTIQMSCIKKIKL